MNDLLANSGFPLFGGCYADFSGKQNTDLIEQMEGYTNTKAVALNIKNTAVTLHDYFRTTVNSYGTEYKNITKQRSLFLSA